jgi:hypothetical protein
LAVLSDRVRDGRGVGRDGRETANALQRPSSVGPRRGAGRLCGRSAGRSAASLGWQVCASSRSQPRQRGQPDGAHPLSASTCRAVVRPVTRTAHRACGRVAGWQEMFRFGHSHDRRRGWARCACCPVRSSRRRRHPGAAGHPSCRNSREALASGARLGHMERRRRGVGRAARGPGEGQSAACGAPPDTGAVQMHDRGSGRMCVVALGR